MILLKAVPYGNRRDVLFVRKIMLRTSARSWGRVSLGNVYLPEYSARFKYFIRGII